MNFHPGNAQSLRLTLIQYIAQTLEVDPESIDPSATFEQLGLDSVTTLGLTGELETLLDRTIQPSLVYDYPSINKLAKCLEVKD